MPVSAAPAHPPSNPPEGLEGLATLALDLRWTYGEGAERIWAELDPEVWDLTRSPWLILQTVSRKRLEEAAQDPDFRERVAAEVRRAEEVLGAPTWFGRAQPDGGEVPTGVAYFSMEFGLSEALPIYSGGLAVLAGDHLKAASDLGVPVIGVGLLYQRGYFRQALDSATGAQTELYPYNEPSQLPIAPVRTADGERLRLRFQLPGRVIWVRAWEARVGRVRLYLLDTNDPLNVPADRGVASELYGGGPELRLQQELLLGIGGWQLLRRLGLRPEVCHLNEGHAAFALLERARCHMEDAPGCPFRTALAATRPGNVFTTHTPVAAGFDRFAPDLIARYLTPYAQQQLGIGLDQLLALGRLRADDPSEPLNMAYLALRGCGAANGVSRLHGEVSRRLFQPLFPRWPACEVPVGHVTNGVHTPSWASVDAHRFLDDSVGPGWSVKLEHNFGGPLDEVTDADLWDFRGRQRREFVDYVRRRYQRQRGAEGASPREIVEASRVLDPNALTLGFARRFATYKRPTLLLADPDRLVRLLTDRHRPVQLIVAGKSHPQDHAGKALVQAWVQFSRRPEVRGRVAFLSDYDMLLARNLVRGVDVWLNTPRRPWEASGTSGMKVLVTGGLNLSVPDGWWAEAYQPDVGWALGDDGAEHHDEGGDPAARDADEAEALYTLLEREVAPAFYDRDDEGLPRAWIARMRRSMVDLTPQFSTARMVQEYAERYYVPAARAYRQRVADGGRGAAELLAWRESLERYWHEVRFGEVRVGTLDGAHRFEAQVYLGELDPDAVAVELFALAPDGFPPVRRAMTRGHELGGAIGGYVYAAEVPNDRPASDYTPRVVPYHPHAAVPAETRLILWER